MKEGKVKLYKFEELDEDVRSSIVDGKRWKVMGTLMDGYNSDYENTLGEFCRIFDVRMKDWQVGYEDYYFSFELSEDLDDHINDFYAEDIKGKHLRRYLNRIFDCIIKGRYYSTHGYTDKNGKYHYRYRYSKVSFDRHDCNLTGVCYDEDILDRVWKVWDKPIPDNYSLHDLVNDCLDDFFSAWHKEYEYWGDTDEAIEEELTYWFENDWFYADGTIFKGILEDAA